MVERLFPNKTRHLNVIFHRVGEEVVVKRDDGTATENEYGKVEDDEVSYVELGYGGNEYGTTAYSGTPVYAKRLYPSYEGRPDEMGTIGGRVDVDNPRIAFPQNIDVQEGDRVEFVDENTTYFIEQRVPRETHNEFRATLVTE